MGDSGVLRFADCELDAARFELRRGGAVVAVEPQVLELITHLARNAGRLVTKDELIATVWGGRIVSDAALASRIKSARRALGDDGTVQRLIKTVHGRGVRFVGAVEGAAPEAPSADRPEPEGAGGQGPTAEPAPEMPSVAVMPFQSPPADPESAMIAHGIAEDLTTALARVPGFFVIAHHSMEAYDSAAAEPRVAARELGVRYLVEGSVRPVEAGQRVHARLIDAGAGGVQLWAGQFDARSGRPFGVDAVTAAILGRLGVELTLAQVRVERARPAADAVAWTPMRRAYAALIVRGWSEESFAEAERECRAALAIDPDFAIAHSVLSLTLGLGRRFALIRRERADAEVIAAADRALALAPGDSEVLSFAGCALSDIGLGERGVRVLERALELDPSNPHAWAALGSALLLQGRVDDGIEKLRHGIRVSPRDVRLAIWRCFLAGGLLEAARDTEALAEAERAGVLNDRFFPAHVLRAAALLRLGRVAEATAAMRDAFDCRPSLSVEDAVPWVGRRLAAELRKRCAPAGRRPT